MLPRQRRQKCWVNLLGKLTQAFDYQFGLVELRSIPKLYGFQPQSSLEHELLMVREMHITNINLT